MVNNSKERGLRPKYKVFWGSAIFVLWKKKYVYACLIHCLCNLQGAMNLGLWHLKNSHSGCRDYLVTELLPSEFSPGAVSLRDPTVAALWLRTLWESLCYCSFGFSGLDSLVWAISVTFPHCSKEISSVLGKSSNSNFPFSAFRAAIPRWLLRPEQHPHGFCSQLKSIYSELPKEVTGMQLLSLGLVNMAWRLQTAGLGIPFSEN